MLRKFLLGCIVVLGSTIGGLVGLAAISVSPSPMVSSQQFSRNAYVRAEQWIKHIRSAIDRDQLNRITLYPDDISDLAFYGTSRFNPGSQKLFSLHGINTELVNKNTIIRMTLKPAKTDLFVNVTLSFSENGELPKWDYAQVGYGYWPGDMLGWFFEHLVLPWMPGAVSDFWKTLTSAVEEFSVTPGQMSLVYRSDEELRKQLKAQAMALMISSPEEKKALQLYLNILAAAALQHPGAELSLDQMFTTLFGLARARSETGSAIEENSRLLKALAIQVADSPVRTLLAPGIKPVPLNRAIVLRGRKDLSQHFLISAALALTLDKETALHIGISKERADSSAGGSGFSMADLVADMAGIQFATIATENEAQARKLQELMITERGEQLFMPAIHWLPPGMSAGAYEELTRHPLYPAMLDKILKRLNSLPIQSEI